MLGGPESISTRSTAAGAALGGVVRGATSDAIAGESLHVVMDAHCAGRQGRRQSSPGALQPELLAGSADSADVAWARRGAGDAWVLVPCIA